MTDFDLQQDMQLLDALTQVRQRHAPLTTVAELQARLTTLSQAHDVPVTPALIAEAVALYQERQVSEVAPEMDEAKGASSTSALAVRTPVRRRISHWRYQVIPDVLSETQTAVTAMLRGRAAGVPSRLPLQLTIPLSSDEPITFQAGQHWFDHGTRSFILVKFDHGPLQKWHVTEGPYWVLNLADREAFLAQLRTAQRMTVEVHYWRAPHKGQYVFPVANLIAHPQEAPLPWWTRFKMRHLHR
jgi:hypothetical protein